MSNRTLKLKLHTQDPRCHWCQRVTVLTNEPKLNKRTINPLMATIDHIYSRFDPKRWIKSEQPKRVLACTECNSRRANEEQKSRSVEELRKRGQGFTLNPRGKPIFTRACNSLEEVLDKLKENGIVLSNDKCTTND